MEPWRVRLSRGETEAAWDLFIDRYRRLILATIRRTIEHDDDVPDVFAHVCHMLSADDLARLRHYSGRRAPKGRFSTWLVVVVRNQTIDWVRHREGRRRVFPPAGLSPVQREIFRHVFADRRSHAEAYELIRESMDCELTFGAFLKELAETYRVVERTRGRGAMRYFAAPSQPQEPVPSPEQAYAISEMGARLGKALATLPVDLRLAVQLFVVDDLPAAEVARVVGWPNAKAVYNRVHRALAALRKKLEGEGIESADL